MMQASNIFVVASCFLFCCEFGNGLNYSLAISTCTAVTVIVVSVNWLGQSDLLRLLRLPMRPLRRQTNQAQKRRPSDF